MGIANDFKVIVSSEANQEVGKQMLDTITDALFGEIKPWLTFMKDIKNLPASAKTLLFYDNFQRFLDGLNHDSDFQRHFREFLNCDEKKVENSKRIIHFIDEMDSYYKIDALLNLTKSASYGFITKREYYKIGKIIENMIIEDLEYISNNIHGGEIAALEWAEEFTRNGLMYVTKDGNYAYSKIAFYMDKFALSFGDDKYKYNGEDDFIPSNFPEAQEPFTFATDEDIRKLFEDD